jgi:hypothetical protein
MKEAPKALRLFLVEYDYAYLSGIKHEIERVHESRLARMQQNEKFSNLQVLVDLGVEDTTWWPTWYEIGLANPWIREAYDPRFKIDSFYECRTVDHLIEKLRYGNWSIGSAFTYKDMCFINQTEGGCEMKVIRRDIGFESWSCAHVIEQDGGDKFKDTLTRMMSATDEQLQTLKYMEAGPSTPCVHCGQKLHTGSQKIYAYEGDTCENCWRTKKLYIKTIVAKVKAGERLTSEDIKDIWHDDRFYACGKGLESSGQLVHWDDEIAIGQSYDYKQITVYRLDGDVWKLTEEYEVESKAEKRQVGFRQWFRAMHDVEWDKCEYEYAQQFDHPERRQLERHSLLNRMKAAYEKYCTDYKITSEIDV